MIPPPLSLEEIPLVLGLVPGLRRLALLHRGTCLAQGVPFVFRSGFRTKAYQQLLHDHPAFHPGTPAAAGGSSKHERAAAYDADTGNALQTAIFGREAKALGLTWGGDFPTPDHGHVELPDTLEQLDAYLLVMGNEFA